ncbi:MAG: XRE family transcriptional regulator [Deltaproteobacteria bacterium]|nr:XRE family transcriptional regulator [Deltaproteobacteria bacterium]
MKSYIEAKSMSDLGKIMRLPKGQISKIEMRTNLVIAIKKNIEKMNFTHARAAQHARVGRTVITSIMNGNTIHISTDRLIDIAQNLGLTITLKVA